MSNLASLARLLPESSSLTALLLCLPAGPLTVTLLAAAAIDGPLSCCTPLPAAVLAFFLTTPAFPFPLSELLGLPTGLRLGVTSASDSSPSSSGGVRSELSLLESSSLYRFLVRAVLRAG